MTAFPRLAAFLLTALTSAFGQDLWTRCSPQPTTDVLRSIAWDGRRFLALGREGALVGSADGQKWTETAQRLEVEFGTLHWVGNQFLVLGQRGELLTSPDGTVWTRRNSGTDIRLLCAIWTGELFVVGGGYGIILTSPDGITWTRRQTPKENDIVSLVWTGSMLVGGADGSAIYFSDDAIHWNAQFVDPEFGVFHSLAWDGRQVFAFWGDTTYFETDGSITKWKRHTSNVGNLGKVATEADRFIAYGSNGIATSTDLIHWTRQTGKGFQALALSGDRWVGVDGFEISSSPDGSTWTRHSTRIDGNLATVAWLNGKLIAVGNGRSAVSEDGIAWVSGTSGMPERRCLTWDGNRYLAGGLQPALRGSDNLWASTDGLAWEILPGNLQKTSNGIAWTGKLIAIVGYDGFAATSPDGLSFTTRETGVKCSFTSMIWTGTQLVAVGSGGCIVTSPDGVAWTSRNSGTSHALTDVVWTGKVLASLGREAGQVKFLSSPDGLEWTSWKTNLSAGGSTLAWTGSHYVTMQDRRIFASTDGVEWTPRDSLGNINSIRWIADKLVAVGGGGLIYTSRGNIGTWARTFSQQRHRSGSQRALDGRFFFTIDRQGLPTLRVDASGRLEFQTR